MQVNQCGNGQSVNFQGLINLGCVRQIFPRVSTHSDILKDFRVNTKSIDCFYKAPDTGYGDLTRLELSNHKIYDVDCLPEKLEKAIQEADSRYNDYETPKFIAEI